MSFLINLMILMDYFSWFIFFVSGIILIVSRLKRLYILAISNILESLCLILPFLSENGSSSLLFQLCIALILFSSVQLQGMFLISFFYSDHKHFSKFLIVSIVYFIGSVIILSRICILIFPMNIVKDPAFSILVGIFYVPIVILILIKIILHMKSLLQKSSEDQDPNQSALIRVYIGLCCINVAIVMDILNLQLITDILRIAGTILIVQGYIKLTMNRFSVTTLTKIHDLEKDLRENNEIRQLLEESLVNLQKANDTKVVFLSNLSHEMRTPLNPIIAYSELMLTYDTGNLSEDQKTYISSIQKSALKLLQIIDQLLNTSLLQQGTAPLDKKTFSLPELVREVEYYFEESIKNKKLSLHIEIDAEVKDITMDRMKLEQILSTLIDNAIKFSYQETKIDIDVKIIEKVLIITITDEGVLIQNEDLPKIFKPFSQLEDPISKKFQGIGLGLYFCHQTVLLLQGKIRVRTVDKLTQFIVSIPLELKKDLNINPPGQKLIDFWDSLNSSR